MLLGERALAGPAALEGEDRAMDNPLRHDRRNTARSRRLLVPLAAALVAIALVVPQASAADARTASRLLLPPLHDGIFRSTCLPSHVAMDDPIVHPGAPGASHQHEFFGNTTTDAYSTYATLRAGTTTCHIAEDTAAYWVPSLYADGQRVAPLKVNAYYLRGRGRGPVVAFPAGLKLIAGNSQATAPQPRSVTGWKCAGLVGQALTTDPRVCPAGGDNVLVIRFPQCWNGRDLDSANHQSHLAYQVGGRCPAGFPVRVPQLSLNVHYHLPALTGLTFASGSIYSAHADFFNAWNQSVLGALVRANLN
jgi:hypothetical protein